MTPREPESATDEPATAIDQARSLTFVFAVRPAAFASWSVERAERSVRHGAVLTAAVVNAGTA